MNIEGPASNIELGDEETKELNCGAERHHYSMFNVGGSMLGVLLSKQPCTMLYTPHP
ncbi:MAG: hypothetical protein PVH37_05730 [Desulfobacterales bacterium]|jgi:hypothetical protein